VSKTGEPMVWAVHLISPSTYDEERFAAMVSGMLECNIGMITCPSAALGMRQYRPILTPTYNSIPRVLEMLAAGVHVRIGSDNVADICSPSTTADLIDEIFVLSAALRFYQPEILAKLALGSKLDERERNFIADHLAKNEEEIRHRT
jgi:adenosine deaminase